MENTQIMTQENNQIAIGFGTVAGFEGLQRQGELLSKSKLLPTQFQGDAASCAIAIDLSNRMRNISPFALIQNLDVILGRPSFSSKFLISLVKTSGLYKDFNFEMSGEIGDAGEVSFIPKKDSKGIELKNKHGYNIYDKKIKSQGRTCVAYAITHDGRKIEGIPVSMATAKLEGWVDKNDSKWQTMPELMLRYRAASFFVKLNCPEIMLGMQTSEEIVDIDSRGDFNPDFEVVEEPKRQSLFKKEEVQEPVEEEPKTESPKLEPTAKEILKSNLKSEGLKIESCKNYCFKNGLIKSPDELISEDVAERLNRGWSAIKTSIGNY